MLKHLNFENDLQLRSPSFGNHISTAYIVIKILCILNAETKKSGSVQGHELINVRNMHKYFAIMMDIENEYISTLLLEIGSSYTRKNSIK